MSDNTPPPPKPQQSEPAASAQPNGLNSSDQEPVLPDIASAGPQDSLAPAPFVNPSLEQQIGEFFGVLIGYNEAQSDLLSEQAASIGHLEREVEAGTTYAVATVNETLGDQVGLLRQLFADEREFLIDQLAGFEALESDDVGFGIDEQARLANLATQRVALIDHEVYSLDSAERVVGELGQPDADLFAGARRLYRINEDLTIGNEQQIVAIYNQESAFGLAGENDAQHDGRARLKSRLVDASGYAVVATVGVGIVAIGQPAVGIGALVFGGIGSAWALARRRRPGSLDPT